MSTPDANLEGNMPEGELNVAQLEGALFPKGDSGEIEIIETITTNPGTDAKVTNIGTRSKAKFRFEIPRGNTGATGNGIQGVTKIGTAGLVDTYRILFTDRTHFDFTVTNADVGSAYTKSETNQLLNAKVDKSSITDDYTSTRTDADKTLLASLYAIKTMKSAIDTVTGVLANLTTTNKTDLVAAINEIVTSVSGKVSTSTFDTAIANLTKDKMSNKYYESTVVANSADFKISSTTTLEAGVEYKVHFAQCSSSSNARLSIDNGTTFYNIDDCSGQALSDEYLTVMFDGTKFLFMTDFGPAGIENVQEVQNNE